MSMLRFEVIITDSAKLREALGTDPDIPLEGVEQFVANEIAALIACRGSESSGQMGHGAFASCPNAAVEEAIRKEVSEIQLVDGLEIREKKSEDVATAHSES